MKKTILITIALLAMMMAFGQNDNARFAFFYEQTQKWGFMDRNGNVVIEPQFEEIHMLANSDGRRFTVPFMDGMAAVQLNGKWGFINTDGQMVITPQFEDVSDFENGNAAGLDNEGNLKFFDKTGKAIDLDNLSTDVTNLECVIDEYGELDLINTKTGARYDDFGLFSEGLARVTHGGYALVDAQLYGAVSGYVDKIGKVVIPLQFGYPANDFHEGLASVSTEVAPDEWKMGFIDKRGQFVIQPQYDWAGDFHEGMAIVKVDEKWGFVDKNGTMVIQPQFYNVGNFSEGMAIYENQERKMGFIDKSGRIAAGPFDSVLIPFNDGLALVADGNDAYYIDKTGKRVLNAIR